MHQITTASEVWIAYGQCREKYDTGEAYRPVLEAIARLCQTSQDPHLLALLRQYALTWLIQMPWVLNESEYDILQRRVSGTTPERMFREFTEVVEMLTARRPFVLVLEDLQWSDEETIDLVAMLGQRRDVAQFMLLGTYRPEEVIERQHPLQTVSQELFLHGYSLEFPLPLLRDTEVECYLTTRFPPREVASRVRTLVASTDGEESTLFRSYAGLCACQRLVLSRGGKLGIACRGQRHYGRSTRDLARDDQSAVRAFKLRETTGTRSGKHRRNRIFHHSSDCRHRGR